MTDIISRLQKKYNLAADSYYLESAYKNLTEENRKDFEAGPLHDFVTKWQPRTPDNWYGCLGLGYPMPSIWINVLDDFLEYVAERHPDFEIKQIKIKFGGIRIYLGKISEQINKECQELERLLSDKHLIY